MQTISSKDVTTALRYVNATSPATEKNAIEAVATETAATYLTSTDAGNTYAPLSGANFTGNVWSESTLSSYTNVLKNIVTDLGIDDPQVKKNLFDYKQVMEEATKSLKIDEIAGAPITATNAINVTKLSPDIDGLTINELKALAKEKDIKVPSGIRRKELVDLVKGVDSSNVATLQELDGPEQKGGAPLSTNVE